MAPPGVSPLTDPLGGRSGESGDPTGAQQVGLWLLFGAPAPRSRESLIWKEEEDPEPQEAWPHGATRPHPEAMLGAMGDSHGSVCVSVCLGLGSARGDSSARSTRPSLSGRWTHLVWGPTGSLGQPRLPHVQCEEEGGRGRTQTALQTRGWRSGTGMQR